MPSSLDGIETAHLYSYAACSSNYSKLTMNLKLLGLLNVGDYYTIVGYVGVILG